MLVFGKRIISLTLALTLSVASLINASATETFGRVADENNQAEARLFLKDHGYLDSVPEERLVTGLTATRAVVVSLLAEIGDVDLKTSHARPETCKDVEESSWYSSAIYWAVQAGIAHCSDEGMFGANVGVTREELAGYIGRYLRWSGVCLAEDETAEFFLDVDQIDAEYVESVELLRSTGVLLPQEDGNFEPKDYVTTGEVEEVMSRLLINTHEYGKVSDFLKVAQDELALYGEREYAGEAYSVWANATGEWSAAFVYWCASQAGLSGRNSAFGTSALSVLESWTFFHSQGLTALRGEGYEPKAGDLIYYYSEQEQALSHMGVVIRYDRHTNMVYTVEGDVENGYLGSEAFTWLPDELDATYPNQSTYIYGFASPDYDNSAGTPQLMGTDPYSVADYIYDSLVLEGYSAAAACGVLGNIYQECRFEFSMNGSSGIGICQWIGGRKQSLYNYCAENGYDASSLEGQVAFLLNVDILAQETYFRSIGGVTIDEFKNLTDTEAATEIFCKSFERPGKPVMNVRVSVAQQLYERYVNGYTGSIGDL